MSDIDRLNVVTDRIMDGGRAAKEEIEAVIPTLVKRVLSLITGMDSQMDINLFTAMISLHLLQMIVAGSDQIPLCTDSIGISNAGRAQHVRRMAAAGMPMARDFYAKYNAGTLRIG